MLPTPTLTPTVTADDATTHTLLNCLTRELCGPEHQLAVDGSYLLLALPRVGARLRIRVRRLSPTGAHRYEGPVATEIDGHWQDVSSDRLAELVEAELTRRSDRANDEFAAQVAASRRGVRLGLDSVEARAANPPADEPGARYLESEQALVLGHRHHPTPKTFGGQEEAWRCYAPEAGAVFGLRQLAVRAHLLVEEGAWPGATAAFDRHRPADLADGYRYLPAHPWQWRMLADHPRMRAALGDGDVVDLGIGTRPWAATASVRTLHDGEDFLKFSLAVRITNCVRKNSWYELEGAVGLTRYLAGSLSDLESRHPGCVMLREPAFRSLALPDADGSVDLTVYEGLGVIRRDGFGQHLRRGEVAALAAALADEYPHSTTHVSHLLRGATAEQVAHWWGRYVDLLVPFTLAAYLDHGLVLEPHLQNVVVRLDPTGMPTGMMLRDLEGTKLVAHTHTAWLRSLNPEVASALTYDAPRGWNRVAYCLFVNHLGEVVSALADLVPQLEIPLWRRVRETVQRCAAERGHPHPLAALLAGVPLPAKANLITRWERAADRDAGYVPLPSPLGPDDLGADLAALGGRR